MAFRLIYTFVSPEIQHHVEDLSLSTPDEVCMKLEIIFKIKKYCEECMQGIDKKKIVKKPLEEQS